MIKLALCVVLYFVGVFGKEIPAPKNSIEDQLSEIEADIPYSVPGDDNSEIIPTNGNF